MRRIAGVLGLRHWQIVSALLLFFDGLAMILSWLAAFMVRFDFRATVVMAGYSHDLVTFFSGYLIIALGIYLALQLYRSIWRFSSIWEMERMIMATCICAIWATAVQGIFKTHIPLSVTILGVLFQFLACLGIRYTYRLVLLLRETRENKSTKKRTMIIGAGLAGKMILNDARRIQSPFKVVCFIDDNPNKHNRLVDGIPVYGDRNSIQKACDELGIDTILMAIPSATAKDKKEILTICQKTGCTTKTLPSLLDIASTDIQLNALQDIKMEDLLGREPIQVSLEAILQSLEEKVILVTGGGGSIGSELCRQIATHNPKKLIIFDVYENNAYDIQNELLRKNPELPLEVIIGSVRDSRRVNNLFKTYHPQIVYHAAAHKHVPLMEDSPCESIKNNVFGTYKVAKAAMEYGAERFVLISTDKAVNPTNIMGASKRLCEMVVQTLNDIASGKVTSRLPQIGSEPCSKGPYYPTQFVAVRFGNVLGSNGSVIPLFEKQIAAGGPVTVTHPEITRFFMTIPEAVSLVLQAGTYAKGGEIFVLDMGEPVKIADLADKLVRLSGHVPGKDIEIVYTGLRPGEKLYEEKLMAEEGLKKTPNDLIHVGVPLDFDRNAFLQSLPQLYSTVMNNKVQATFSMVKDLVSTYKPAFEQDCTVNTQTEYKVNQSRVQPDPIRYHPAFVPVQD